MTDTKPKAKPKPKSKPKPIEYLSAGELGKAWHLANDAKALQLQMKYQSKDYL